MNQENIMQKIFFAFTAAIVCVASGAVAEDLRDQMGTNDMVVAQEIQEAMRLEDAKQLQPALDKINDAIKRDPNACLAYAERGHLLFALSRIDESIESYKLAVEKGSKSKMVTVDSAINIGLTFGRLGRFDESNVWFSRGCIEDPNNLTKLRGKAYRNMAINLFSQKRFVSAYLSALLAYADDPQRTKLDMVQEFASKVVEGDEVAQLLYMNDEEPAVKPRETAGALIKGNATSIKSRFTSC